MSGQPRRAALATLALLAIVTPASALTHYENGSCQIIGDPDLYGIGVRIGYYFTFFAGILCIMSNRKKGVTDSLKGVNVVVFVMIIILMRNTLQGSFAILEWYIVTNLVLVLQTMSLFWVFFQFDGTQGVASWGVFYVLYAFNAGVQPWLYWKRLQQGRNLDCDSFQMFIFVGFDFYTYSYIKFLQVLSIFACVGSPFILILGAYLIVSSMQGATKLEETCLRKLFDKLNEQAENRAALEPITKTWRKRHIHYGIANLMTGSITISSLEKILQINHVDLSEVPFTSTGQLIPFLVGLFTFLSTIWDILLHRDEKRPPLILRLMNDMSTRFHNLC